MLQDLHIRRAHCAMHLRGLYMSNREIDEICCHLSSLQTTERQTDQQVNNNNRPIVR